MLSRKKADADREARNTELRRRRSRSFEDFVAWEKAHIEAIDVKPTYVRMAGRAGAGIVLSQIVYWFLPRERDGKSKLYIFDDGLRWIAKTYDEWSEEVGLSRDRVRGAVRQLVALGLIHKEVHIFGGQTKVHIRLNEAEFLRRLGEFDQDISNGESEEEEAESGRENE